MLISFTLSSVLFAAGMAILFVPFGLLIDLVEGGTAWHGVYFTMSVAGASGIFFGAGMVFYLRHLDQQIILPDLLPEEEILFQQYGFIITKKKYDPGRIVITNQRLFLLPTHYNAGGKIADFVVSVSDLAIETDSAFGSSLARKQVQVLKDHSFGEDIAGQFILLKFKKKLVFTNSRGRKIAYMSNLGYPLPSLEGFK